MTDMLSSSRLFGRLRGVLVSAVAALSMTAGAQADPAFPFAELPESFVGMDNGVLQPKNTLRPYVGSQQTAPSKAGQGTGRQVYFGGLRYRRNGNWQLGWNLSIYDDPPAAPINGRQLNISQLSTGVDLKYSIYSNDRLSAAVHAGAEYHIYKSGAAITNAATQKTNFVGGTISIPVTYRLSDNLWVTGEAGYTAAASTLEGNPGFGARSFVSGGAAYRVSDRIFAYGSLKALSRNLAGGIDAQDAGGRNFLYTLGAQFGLTPQSAINLYMTNLYAPTPVGDDFLFYPDKVNPVYGFLLTYIPSGRGTGEAASRYYPVERVQTNRPSRFADGFTVTSPHTLASDRFRARVSYGSAGTKEVSLFHPTDPDFQYEVSFEDYALNAGSNFRSEVDEDIRYMVGGRWQAMDEAYGHPVNLAFRVFAGRDAAKPTLGTIYAEAMASKTFGQNIEVTVNPRAAAFGSTVKFGAGLGVHYSFSNTLTAIGEYTYVRGDDAVWALGLRKSFSNVPFTVDLFTTNAVGLSGVGSLLSNDKPQFGISLHWETGFDWL